MGSFKQRNYVISHRVVVFFWGGAICFIEINSHAYNHHLRVQFSGF